MSENAEFAKALAERLANVNPDQVTRETPLPVSLQVGEQEVHLSLTAVDQLACAVHTVGVPTCKSPATGQLKRLGDLLAERMQYLVEPIATIELDDADTTLQMRSSPPTDHGNHIRSYYELVGERDGVALKRFTARRGEARKQIDMHFTREILARLVTDLCQAIREVTALS